MGFGMLFVGWFLLLNVFYYTFTDLICGLVIAYASLKLSRFDRNFRVGCCAAIAFALYGAVELVFSAIYLASPTINIGWMESFWFLLIRYFLLAAIAVASLFGIYAIGKEVDALDVSGRARRFLPFTIAVYAISALLEIPAIGGLLGSLAPTVYFLSIVLTLVMTGMNLSLIYRAYMRICLPEDLIRDSGTPKNRRKEESEK